MRIAVVAPSCTLKREAADRVLALVASRDDCEVVFHPQCFLSDGHFAGPDEARLAALLEVMADPGFGAVWFARGGYGSNRIAEDAMARLPGAAGDKVYMGYSDAGFLLAALHKAGLEVAWGPMCSDIFRSTGASTVGRALDWMVRRDPATLEPGIAQPAMAFNLTVLSSLLGTPIEPDFTGVDLMIEEVSEQLYRIDRTMFHVTGSANVRRCARIRLGQVSDVIPNEPEFGGDAAGIVDDWCRRSGIRFGGRAEIGHDAGNRVVPFGRAAS